MRPGRNDARQVVLPGPVGVDIGLHLDAPRPGIGDARHQFRHLAPHRVLGDLEVNDIDRQPGPPADLERLGHRLEHPFALGPHMSRVDAAVGRRRLAHGYQRIRVDPVARRAAQRAGHSQSALLHSLAHQFPHLLPLGLVRRTGLLPVHVGPDLRRAHIGADVGRNPLFEQFGEVAREIGPALAPAAPALLAAHRRRRAALPEDHRGDALPDHALGVAVGEQCVVGVVMDIDQPRGHHLARGIDGPPRRTRAELADRRDSAVANADIGDVGGVPGPVHHPPVDDQRVEVLRRQPRSKAKQKTNPIEHLAGIVASRGGVAGRKRLTTPVPLAPLHAARTVEGFSLGLQFGSVLSHDANDGI
jgi:hypothetical protein